jgi:hypothetical protein
VKLVEELQSWARAQLEFTGPIFQVMLALQNATRRSASANRISGRSAR